MRGPLLTDRHFLSNDELLDRVAQGHHDAINNPEVLALRPKLEGRESWAELRTAGYRALETIGKEIARAKTEGEAQAATLRWEKYIQAIDNIDKTLFGIAVRRLAKGAVLTATGGYVGLLAYGRPKPDANLGRIPETHWAAGMMDWQRRQLLVKGASSAAVGGSTAARAPQNTPSDELMWSGIEILDLSDLPREVAAVVIGREAIDIDDRLNVSHNDLKEFLDDHVTNNNPDCAEEALWEAARYKFRDYNVPRRMVRDWIRDFMPEDKRNKRGRPKVSDRRR